VNCGSLAHCAEGRPFRRAAADRKPGHGAANRVRRAAPLPRRRSRPPKRRAPADHPSRRFRPARCRV